MNYSQDDLDSLIDFYRAYYKEQIFELAEKYPQEKSSLWVDFTDIHQHNPDLADDLADRDPGVIREMLEEALSLYDLPVAINDFTPSVRVHNMPDSHTRTLEELRDNDVERLRAISAQIAKASAVRPKVQQAAWECQRCGTYTRLPIKNELQEPHQCQGCERQGPFVLDYQESDVVNHQKIRLKQPPEDATQSAQIGNEIDAHVTGDLVGLPQAGDRADVVGVLNAERDGDDPTLDFWVDAWAVDQRNDDYSDLNIEEHKDEIKQVVEGENPFEVVADSIAPAITGGEQIDIETPWGETHDKYWWLRLACGVATLFGGWRRENEDGTHQRGSSHTLIIGDPSTGKSTIMDAITEISPRSTTESGKNTSGVGLTAAAVKDDFGGSQWSLEAGALVKAHQGVCGIDEIDKMDKDGLDRLHRALEKQRLEISKAGIKATLKCETTLLAAGNPEDSRFSEYDSDTSQIDIVASLMDRFDLVYTLKDKPDERRDREIAKTKINQRTRAGLRVKGETDIGAGESDPRLPVEKMRAWVAHARQEIHPVIRDEAVEQAIEDYYVKIRQSNTGDDDEDNPLPATVRTLDGILRLSEACARLRLSEEIKPVDVELATTLIEISLQDIGYDADTGQVDIDVASGRGSWSQKERKTKLEGIVETLEGASGADREDVIETATSAGMERSNVEHDLQKMREKGILYQPQKGTLRTT